MNQTIDSYLGYALSVILTMTALAYTFWSMLYWPDHFELIPSSATVFVEQTDIPEDIPMTGAQVVAKLYELHADESIPISVNGFTFYTFEDVEENQGIVALDALYRSEVIINGDGKVIKLILEGV